MNDNAIEDINFLKILPHHFFPTHEISIWVDSNIILKGDLKLLAFQSLEKHDVAYFIHFNNLFALEKELHHGARTDSNELVLIIEQLKTYKSNGMPADTIIPECRIIIRKHNKAIVIETMTSWLEEIKKYGVFSEISLSYAAWKNNIEINAIDENFRSNTWFIVNKEHYIEKRCVNIKKNYLKSDFVFLSFPKSGRTWVRFFLAKYLECKFSIPFSLNFPGNNFCPRITFKHDYFDAYQDCPGNPVLLFPETLTDKPLAIMVRDPRDVVVSYYHQKQKREGYNFKNIDEFIFSNIYGIERQSIFVLNLINFYENHTGPKIMLHYEALHAEPKTYFSRLISFLIGEVVDSALDYAMYESSFNRMQDFEKTATSNSQGVIEEGRLGVSNWDGDTEALKVRSGKCGKFNEILSSDAQEKIMSLPSTKKLIETLKHLMPKS